MKKIISLLLILLIIFSMMTGCSKDNNSNGGTKKDSIVFVGKVKADTFDMSTGSTIEPTIMRSIYSTLVKFDADGKIIPSVAKNWEESDDGMSYIFKLRDDIKFHDGSSLTADDFIYTMDVITSIPLNAWIKTTDIASWEKIDDYTVKVNKCFTYSMTLEILAQVCYILPKSVHEKDPIAFDKNPIGSGAYKFVSQDIDGTVNLEANENYFLGIPELKKLTIKPPIDISTAIIALETGEVDMIQNIPAAQLKLLEQNKNIVTETTGDHMQ